MFFRLVMLFVVLVVARGPGHAQTSPVPVAMRVMTWNIRYDNPDDGVHAWPKRRDELIGLIRSRQVDVLCIQEGLHRQVQFLTDGLPGFEMHGVGRDDGKEEGEYAAIFTRTGRFVCRGSGNFWLSPTPDVPSKGWDAALPRIVSWVKLYDSLAHHELFVFNTHFDHQGVRARENSARLIREKVRAIAGEDPFILAGDFNAGPKDSCYRILVTRSDQPPFFTDAMLRSLAPHQGPLVSYTGFPFTSTEQQERIDFIFVNEATHVRRHAILDARRGPGYISDHLPVEADVVAGARSPEHQAVTVYTTADSTTDRLARRAGTPLTPSTQPLETETCVFVTPGKTFQTFLGIGGAITDASAEVFAALPRARQDELLTAYFDPAKGIGYTLARTTIHSSDFSSGSYTYCNEGDAALKTFSIAHDRQYRIPLIKQAIKAAGGTLLLYASPWSPPAFMKSNGSMLKGGKLLPAFARPWAHYIARFIKAYEAEGIPVWGISVQNEPMATQTWESCIFTAEEERDFLKLHLGPTLAAEGLADKKIIVWDHNRDLMKQRVDVIYGDPEAARYAWGTGFHWYESWSGGREMYENVRAVQECYPGKNLLFTEGCAESFDSTHYQWWPNAERYGRSMINDFNNGTVGWTDWNILLDDHGGPNHVGNFCFAPIHVNGQTRELIYTPSYYYIGHFSRFIRPGALRVSTVSSRSRILSTSFLNPDGSLVTVVMNPSEVPVNYRLIVDGQSAAQAIPAHGIQTLVY